MSIDSIRAEILDIVDDDSLENDAVDALINKALLYIATRVPLPALETYHTEEDVTGLSIYLPGNYLNGLFSVKSDDVEISLLPSVRDLDFDSFGDGRRICAISQNSLLFSDTIDAAMDITIGYYRAPEEDEVEIMPAGYEEDPIINYCCWKLFNKIEDGHTDNKPNTRYYRGELDLNIKELRTLLQASQPQYKMSSDGKDFI